jgi:hypothetical protein
MGGHIVARPFFFQNAALQRMTDLRNLHGSGGFSQFFFLFQHFTAFTRLNAVGSAPFCALYPTAKSLSTGHVAAQDKGTQS